LKERIARSGFFFGAVLFHLVIALMLIGYIVWQPAPPEKPSDFTDIPPAVQPPPNHQPSPISPAPPGVSVNPIALDNGTIGAPKVPISPKTFGPDVPGINSTDGPGAGVKVIIEDGPSYLPPKTWIDLRRIKEIVEGRRVNGNPDFLKFPIYIAKYADGDWDCNTYMHDGVPASGALPNLMAKIHEWSHGELDGRQIKVVDLASPEILNNPPPFIFFTGHKDFHLTDAEVENLRKYLQIGGALWGDSAFAGDGSRFDVAFHREMKRVLPDKDLPFEDMPMDHDIFTAKTKWSFDEVPPGMNRRADPVQCINLDGKLAVLYTPNDYSDMMTMLLLPGRENNEAQMDGWNHWEPNHPLFTNGFFVWHAASFFRNYEPASAMASYKLSMNILIHLLHRYDEEIELITP
jgi:hypothetical protein